MDDSDRIIQNENIIEQIDALQKQIDALTKQHDSDLITIKAWKIATIAKVQQFESRISALESA